MRISDDIINRIQQAARSSTPVVETANLYTDLGFDSLAFVRLLLEIEEALSIPIELIEMDACLHVGTLIALVEMKMKEAGYDSTSVDRPEQSG